MKPRILLLAFLPVLGCAHGGKPDIATLASNSDRLIWDAGQKALQKREWDSARQHFRRIVDGFPQSEFGPEARLSVAESYYREGGTANFILAVSSYREFLTYYPSHPRSHYAQFQIAEAFYKQKNGPDRDQTSTAQALEEYQRLLEQYPSSEHVPAARDRIKEVRKSLAEAEFKAGYFYQRTRQAFRAAITRYQGVVKDYPDYEAMDQVLYRLGECLILAGRNAEAPPYLSRLIKEYPTSVWAAPGKELLERPVKPSTAAPAATPSPVPSPESGPPASPSPSPR